MRKCAATRYLAIKKQMPPFVGGIFVTYITG